MTATVACCMYQPKLPVTLSAITRTPVRRDFIIFQGQEMMPAWDSLLQGLRSGNVPWAEAHPAEAAVGRDFWGYLKVCP